MFYEKMKDITERAYSNIDGHDRSLSQMVHEDPEWAASRIKECERLECEVIPELQQTIAHLREHARVMAEDHAVKLDKINQLAHLLYKTVSS